MYIRILKITKREVIKLACVKASVAGKSVGQYARAGSSPAQSTLLVYNKETSLNILFSNNILNRISKDVILFLKLK